MIISHKYLLLSTTLLTVLISISSCDKHRAKKLAGTYVCQVDYHRYTIPDNNFDTTYWENITITQDKKYLTVLEEEIHIDSLWKREEKYFSGGYGGYMDVIFRNDSVFITKGTSSHGGASRRVYTGMKIN
jgi:hypothetical protein